MFVIKNKLSLSYRRVKSMHYPESPKVTPRQPTIYQGAKNYIKFVYGGKKFLKLSIEFQVIKP